MTPEATMSGERVAVLDGDYEVDEQGRVFSTRGWRAGREIAGYPHRGYVQVQVTRSDGTRRKTYVHQLVCPAFHGPQPSPKHEIRHLNGVGTDNRASNLAWGTDQENVNDREAHGRTAYGERNGYAKLTDADVLAIRAARDAGESMRTIADRFGINHGTVSRIVNRKRWAHL